ncbi:hypothetical protein GCM10027019_18280 [Melaminivora jejuensis]|uniref:c-type cytochrome n=1 Tax=Melaminivora jejuensis TaxID=1267217 RepID=UPI001ADF9C44|nr:c-type cytochrome [Melaminivora jejuensis]UHJ65660.1 hypothetical protein LVC68_03830 [Melaminivora jejuensis]
MPPLLPSLYRAFWLALLLASPFASAQPGALDTAVLAGTCFNCHGPDGRSAGALPSLQGRSPAELRQRLHAFQRGQAPDATVMTRLMKGYDDAQIEALAQWFARKEGQ